MTYLCVPIFVRDRAQTLRDIATAAEAGADMIELRLDHAGNLDMRSVLTSTMLPCIATCRPPSEGGHYEGSEHDRILILARAQFYAAYVDAELASNGELASDADQSGGTTR